MKKSVIFLLTLSIVMSMIGFGCTSVYALTSNPDTYCAYFDFEDGNLPHATDLTSYANAADSFSVDVVNTDAKNGTYALHTKGTGYVSIPVGRALAEGTTVKVSYWINVMTANDQKNIKTSLRNDATSSMWVSETTDSIIVGTYKQISTTYTWTAANGSLKDVCIFPGRIAGNETEAYIDDISIEILPQEYQTVRYSFDFDDGQMPDFYASDLTFGTAKVESAAAYKSSYGLHVKGKGRVSIATNESFAVGTTVRVSYSINLLSSSRNTIETALLFDGKTWKNGRPTPTKNTWTNISYSYIIQTGDGAMTRISLTPGTVTSVEAEAYIDNIIVEVIPADSTKSLSAKKNVRANVDFESGVMPAGVSATDTVTTKEVIADAAKNGSYGLHTAGKGRVEIDALDEAITAGTTVKVSFWIKVNSTEREDKCIEVGLYSLGLKNWADVNENRTKQITVGEWEKIDYSYTWTDSDGSLDRISITPGKITSKEFDAYLDDIQVSVIPADYKAIDVLFTGINGYRSFVYSNETKAATVVFASYSDDALLDAKIVPVTLNGGEWSKIAVPDGFDYSEAKTVRVFMWDMTKYSIRPLTINNTINR